MEMNFDIIEFYMKSIHTMSKVNSFFFNVNRYKKEILNSQVTLMIKNGKL